MPPLPGRTSSSGTVVVTGMVVDVETTAATVVEVGTASGTDVVGVGRVVGVGAGADVVGTVVVGTAGTVVTGAGTSTGRGRNRSTTDRTASLVTRDSWFGVRSSTSRSALSASTSS